MSEYDHTLLGDERLDYDATPGMVAGFHDLIERLDPSEEDTRALLALSMARFAILSTDLEQEKSIDKLTELYTRWAFKKDLPDRIERNAKSGGSTAVFVIDMDGFKLANDKLGHAVGDQLLHIFGSKTLKNQTRHNLDSDKKTQPDALARLRPSVGEVIDALSKGKAARLGGDEFAIAADLQPEDESGISFEDQAKSIAARLEPAFKEDVRVHFTDEAHKLDPTYEALGLSVAFHIHTEGETPDEMLESADAKMRIEKNERKMEGISLEDMEEILASCANITDRGVALRDLEALVPLMIKHVIETKARNKES